MTSLCDVNVWLALALSGHAHQAVAAQWLESVTDQGSILFCRATQQGLLRLLTNAAVLAPYGNPPLTNRQAWDVYQAFLADDRIELLSEEPLATETHWIGLAVRDSASPKVWMDAYLAGFAIAAGCRLVTTDHDFRHFPGLELVVLA